MLTQQSYNYNSYNNYMPNNLSESIKEITCSFSISKFDMENATKFERMDRIQTEVVQALSLKLAEEIYNNDYVQINTFEDLAGMSTVYNTKIKLCKTESNYVNFVGNVFKIGDETFSNDELVQSIKNTFPEKFI